MFVLTPEVGMKRDVLRRDLVRPDEFYYERMELG